MSVPLAVLTPAAGAVSATGVLAAPCYEQQYSIRHILQLHMQRLVVRAAVVKQVHGSLVALTRALVG
jgi:hypothetical protein